MSFQMFQFFLPNGGLVLSLLGRSGKTPPQSCDCSYRTTALLNFSPARLTITAPGARQFLRGKPKLLLTQNPLTQTPLTQILSATSILALRDRGLLLISPSDAVSDIHVGT